MHRTATLGTARAAGTAIISTGTARASRTAIISTLIVSSALVVAAGCSTGSTRTTHERLAGTHGAGINRTTGNRAGWPRRHSGPRRRRRTGGRWTGTQSRHHIGARRNDWPCLRLTGEIRFCGRTQRLRWRRLRGRTRPRHGRTGRRNAGQTRRGWARSTRRHHRWRCFRSVSHAWGERLSGSRQNLARFWRRDWLGGNRRTSRKMTRGNRICRYRYRGCVLRHRRRRWHRTRWGRLVRQGDRWRRMRKRLPGR